VIISFEACTGGQELCGSLSHLQELHIGGHGLAGCGSEVLLVAVQHMSALKQLVVKFAISNAGVVRLAPSLRTNRGLASLQLSAAAIGDAGAAALALSLPYNSGLRELNLSRVRVCLLVVLNQHKSQN
jgi:hypothetical protein